MSNLQKVYYGMSGTTKSKLKNSILVYENKENAKEFANNYTDLNKEPKVLVFDLNTKKILDLTTDKGKKKFVSIIKQEGLEDSDILNCKKEYFDDEKEDIEILDHLSLKKTFKILNENFDIIKGYSLLDENKVTSYIVLNTDVLINKEVLEIDLEGDLWKVEFKIK